MVERVLVGPNGATETTLAAILVELGQKLETGQEVALDAPTLAALKSITVANLPADYPDVDAQALLASILTAVQSTLTVDGTVSITQAQLDVLAAALEAITVSGTVALDAPTLAALESINALVTNLPADYPLPDAQVAALTPPTTVTADQGAAGADPWPVDIGGATVSVSNLQTDALTDTQLRATDVNTADSGEREYTHVVATVTSVGDTTVHTPASGKAVRLRWIYAINNPTATSAPLIKVKLGATEIYRVWALSKRQVVTGAVNAPLVVNLDAGGIVAVTALIEEV